MCECARQQLLDSKQTALGEPPKLLNIRTHGPLGASSAVLLMALFCLLLTWLNTQTTDSWISPDPRYYKRLLFLRSLCSLHVLFAMQ